MLPKARLLDTCCGKRTQVRAWPGKLTIYWQILETIAVIWVKHTEEETEPWQH